MRKNKRIFPLVLIVFFLLPFVFGIQVNAHVANYSTVHVPAFANSKNIDADKTVTRSFLGNVTGIITGDRAGGEHQMLLVSFSNSPSFTRHLMCKDFHPFYYDPIEPTTVFRPSDAKAVCLTTVNITYAIEFRWYYRSNSSKTWVSCLNTSKTPLFYGKENEYNYEGHLLIAGYGLYYPRAYKVEVYLDGFYSFSEFFEITNGGLTSPRVCEEVDNGHPVSMKSRFTVGVDTKAYHYLRLDKIAYFNEELECCHDFTTVWIQPNGSTYKTYTSSFPDYKDSSVTWDYWTYRYTSQDYISVNSSTPVGNWKVEVYLDSYYLNNTWVRYGPIATTPFVVGSEPVADWTFMVYLDGDGSLEAAGIDVFLKMASIGSSSQVNIVAQMDRHPDWNMTLGYDDRYGNWTDCNRFNVTKSMTPTPGNATLNLGEVNMGDPDTLKDFVNWTMSHYPASFYALVLFGHGTGCMGACFDITNERDALSLPELSQALDKLPAIMDIVLFDACGMGMTEVAYQIKDHANILVGPEGLGYSPAPYDRYVLDLTIKPSMLPSEFASAVVTDYIDWCEQQSTKNIPDATMSAIDLTNITSLTAVIDDFALKLMKNENFYDYLIYLARNQTEGYEGPYTTQIGYLIDLHHFAHLVNQHVLDEELQNITGQVTTTLEEVIIMKDNKNSPDSHGLSIYFPDEEDKYFYTILQDFETSYEGTSFAEGTPWDEFLRYYLNSQTSGHILTIQTPYSDITVQIDEESYTTDADKKVKLFILPGSYSVSVPTNISTKPYSREAFSQWKNSHNDESNPTVVDISNDDLTLDAEYELQYYLTINIDLSGSTLQANVPPSEWYKEGDKVPLAAEEISGYVFDHWIVDGARRDTDSIEIEMNKAHNATAYYVPPPPWWETLLRPDIMQVVLGLVGIVLTVALVFPAWVRTRRKRGIIKTFLNEIDEIYSKYKTNPQKCEEELYRLRNTILEGLTDGKITEESYNILDKRLDKYMEETQSITEAPAEPTTIEVAEVLPDRIPSGHPDLDNMLLGGIPKNYTVILTSPSCDERDLLIKRFLETGAKEGEVTFHITTNPGETSKLAEEFQPNFYLLICNPQADKISKSLPNIFKLKGVENLTDISIALTKAFCRLDTSTNDSKRACVEIVSDILLQHGAVQTRKFLTELITELKSRGFTTLAVMNPQMHPSEEVHAILGLFEGEINIYEKETKKELERFLKIKKMYNQRYLRSDILLKNGTIGDIKK